MSGTSVGIALNHSRATGTAKLVLIGIADHDGDGGSWPSVSTLARYAGVSRRNVQKAVEKLEALHEVRRHVQQGGDHRFSDYERPNRYDFLLSCPADCDGSRQHRTARHDPVELDVEDPASVATPPVGSDAPPLSVATPKQSLNQTTYKTKKARHLPERARARCGHELIDDRHCTHGCPITEAETA